MELFIHRVSSISLKLYFDFPVRNGPLLGELKFKEDTALRHSLNYVSLPYIVIKQESLRFESSIQDQAVMW